MNLKRCTSFVVMCLIGFALSSCGAGPLLRYVRNDLVVIPSRVPNKMSVNGVYHSTDYDAFLAGGTFLTDVDGRTVLAVRNIRMDVSYILTDDIRPGPNNNRIAMIPHSNGSGTSAWLQEFIIPSFVRNDVLLLPIAFNNYTNRGTWARLRANMDSKPILSTLYLKGCSETLLLVPLDEDSPGRAGYAVEWDDQKSFFPRVIYVNRPTTRMERGLFGNPIAMHMDITEMLHADACNSLVP
jgi:hypothetical protein